MSASLGVEVEPGDRIMPRLELLQGMSKKVLDGKGTVGTIVNGSTGEVIKSVHIVPVKAQKVRWLFAESAKDRTAVIINRNDERLKGVKELEGSRDEAELPFFIPVFNFTVVVNGNWDRPMILTLKGTSYRPATIILNTLDDKKLPIFGLGWNLSAEKVKAYFKFNVEVADPLSAEDLVHAEEVFKSLNVVEEVVPF